MFSSERVIDSKVHTSLLLAFLRVGHSMLSRNVKATSKMCLQYTV